MVNHVAIIMDGNGRWAQARGHNRFYGHVRGSKIAKGIVEAAVESKVKELTLFALSTENWSRPKEEIEFLFKVLSKYIKTEKQKLLDKKIKFNCIGDLNRVPDDIREQVKELESLTANNKAMVLTLALSYGGQEDIMIATRALMTMAINKEISPKDLTKNIFSSALMTNDLSSPDLIIRTSGECRLSNFFLWQSAYSELYFEPKMWPDYTKEDFSKSLKWFASRSRRYGLTTEQIEERTSL